MHDSFKMSYKSTVSSASASIEAHQCSPFTRSADDDELDIPRTGLIKSTSESREETLFSAVGGSLSAGASQKLASRLAGIRIVPLEKQKTLPCCMEWEHY